MLCGNNVDLIKVTNIVIKTLLMFSGALYVLIISDADVKKKVKKKHSPATEIKNAGFRLNKAHLLINLS